MIRLCLVCALLVPFVVQAKGKPSARPLPVQMDSNFHCKVNRTMTRAWVPRGLSLPENIAQKFRFWKRVKKRGEAVPECSALPATEYIINETGRGNVSRFDLVVATQPVTIYRVFSTGPFTCSVKKPGGRYGVWWSFEKPRDKRAFREGNAICAEWNQLSMKVSCILKSGTVVAVGPTQSADCGTEALSNCPQRPAAWANHYGASPHHQIYLNLFNRPESDVKKFLTNCRVSPWTDPE